MMCFFFKSSRSNPETLLSTKHCILLSNEYFMPPKDIVLL